VKRLTKRKNEYSTVSLHNKVLAEVDRLVKDTGFWPSRSTFVREAVIEKIKREWQAFRESRSDPTGKRGAPKTAPQKRKG